MVEEGMINASKPHLFMYKQTYFMDVGATLY